MSYEIVTELEGLEFLKNDLERAEYLQNLLLAYATGGGGSEPEYKILRAYFIENKEYENLLPDFVRTKRDLSQFWNYIKPKFSSYAERREFLWEEFSNLLNYLERGEKNAVSENLAKKELSKFGVTSIHSEVKKALERVAKDPEGAITSARTILETVLKHIADERTISYSDNTELSVLYREVARDLNMSPDQHSEDIFKQILGGCSAVVNGLGLLRNKLGDAHGKSSKAVKPNPRHAELAVNLAGSMAAFLLETHLAK